MTYPAGFVLFCGAPSDDVSLEAAREYIAARGLTSEDVKIVRGEDKYVSVVAKRAVNLVE